MSKFEDMTKEELIKLLDKQINRSFKEKATLKDLFTTNVLKGEDTLFLIPNGYLIGKPYIEEEPLLTGYIILSDVVIFESLTHPIRKVNFNNMSFQLAVDQIVAFTPIDRKSFLAHFETPR